MHAVFEALEYNACKRPDVIAFHDDKTSVTWSELIHRVANLSDRLADAPKTIGIALAGGIDYVVADLAITLTTPDLSGESRISVDYLWNYTRANRKFHAELWLDGITTGTLLFEHDQEPKDTGNLTPVSFTTKPIELTGVHTLELFIYGSNISDDATIEKATVSIKRWV